MCSAVCSPNRKALSELHGNTKTVDWLVSSTLWPEVGAPRALGRSWASPAAELWRRGWWQLRALRCSAFSPGPLGEKTSDAQMNRCPAAPPRLQTLLHSARPTEGEEMMKFRSNAAWKNLRNALIIEKQEESSEKIGWYCITSLVSYKHIIRILSC